MQDRFKFRMYDTNVNKMYMPNDFEEVESIYECIKQQINWDLDVDYDIKFNHLENGRFFMQCIGLKDKNGKLIYEGDIVKIFHVSGTMQGKYFFDVVEWNDLRCRFDTENYGIMNDDDVYEVIGNIYENPELLEKGGVN